MFEPQIASSAGAWTADLVVIAALIFLAAYLIGGED
jgi:hypothetical protein